MKQWLPRTSSPRLGVLVTFEIRKLSSELGHTRREPVDLNPNLPHQTRMPLLMGRQRSSVDEGAAPGARLRV
ncbi:hypothetical protein AB4Z14_13720 [Terrabacter sp. 2TAF16]|uniref:hypothetical protein n=1 Tax=Terrabacter sp. 2TAF16 TaxID=3233008 RepID=UPI003F99147B